MVFDKNYYLFRIWRGVIPKTYMGMNAAVAG